MINNFTCAVCNKYKSHGRPRKDGRWVCLNCIYAMNVKFGKKERGEKNDL